MTLENTPGQRLTQTVQRVLLFLVFLWGVLSTVQVFRGALSESGGNDLYTYWYAGLHIRQGNDPYDAFLSGTDPALPLQFLDGVATDKDEIIRSNLQPAPGLTFPLILLLTPFSWLSFPSAKIAWFVLLMLINLLIPALLLYAMRMSPDGNEKRYLLMLAFFLGFSSTRYATISGQPSILVIALMLMTWILSEDRPTLAGVLLGIALSKYSLSLGFWIYFTIFERRPKLSITAAGVQFVGLMGLAWLGQSSVLQAIDGYVQLFLHHAPMEGIQLTSLLPGVNAYSPTLAIALTLITGIPLYVFMHRYPKLRNNLIAVPTKRALLLSVLTFWSLMVAYHRAYDLQVFIIALGTIMLFRSDDEFAAQGRGWLRLTDLYAVLSILILSLPAGGILRSWLPEVVGPLWIRTILRASTWVVLIGMVLFLTLLLRDTAFDSKD